MERFSCWDFSGIFEPRDGHGVQHGAPIFTASLDWLLLPMGKRRREEKRKVEEACES
jgi:hypothetical protein